MTDISQALPPTQAQANAANSAAGAQAIATPTDFARALLAALGDPDTPQNEQALIAWAAAEGGNWNNTATYNPFNTTLTMPGSSVMAGGNTAGVQAYTSWQQGVDATVRTLEGGGYSAILDALRQGKDAQAVANAIVNSPWGTKSIDLGSAGTYASQSGTYGGGVVSAGGGQAGTTGGAAPPYTPGGNYPITPQVRAWVMQNAPQDAWMLDNPDLAPILGWAGANAITDPNEVTGLISQTDWYKSHSAAQRNWTQLYAADPQEAAREIQQSKSLIMTQAKQAGVTLTDDQLDSLSINDNYYGWTQQELQYAIAAYLPAATQPTAGGAAQVNFQSLKATATQTWGVPTSDQQIEQWVTQVAAGTQTMDGINALLKQQAQSLYPTLADQFARGFTFATATDPYKQIAQQYLGVPADQINFTDPKWMAALSGPPDPKTGQRTEMGLDAWTNYVRSNPQYGYQNTTMAKNQAYDTANQLAVLLGKVVP